MGGFLKSMMARLFNREAASQSKPTESPRPVFAKPLPGQANDDDSLHYRYYGIKTQPERKP